VYFRDKRSPVPKSETVSRIMSANKAKNTGPELTLRKALWSAGIRGYRLHPKKVVGRPDIAFIGRKLAIFVHGASGTAVQSARRAYPNTTPLSGKQNSTRMLRVTSASRRSKSVGVARSHILGIVEFGLSISVDLSFS
jgi:DNA mismatch endonuclease Vsr